MRIPRPLHRAVARTKPLVPDRLWPLLLTLRSLPGTSPMVGRPHWRRAVVLAAHPDDESLGCGGTLAQLADAGAELSAVFVTDGDATRGSARGPATTGRARRLEAEAACRVLGVGTSSFLGVPDGEVGAHVDAVAGAITAAVTRASPEALLLPWFLDGHPDHQALSAALGRAKVPAHLEVWAYETWTPLPANRIVDVSAVIDRKRRALAAHATAHLAFDVGASLGLSRWRSIHGLMGRGYAEAFLAAPAGEYLALVRGAATAGLAPGRAAPGGGEPEPCAPGRGASRG